MEFSDRGVGAGLLTFKSLSTIQMYNILERPKIVIGPLTCLNTMFHTQVLKIFLKVFNGTPWARDEVSHQHPIC